MARQSTHKIAVIGAGLAGASCAQALLQAGHSVHIFDKARGPGGRLATRRMEWMDEDWNARITRLDHGAISLTATTATPANTAGTLNAAAFRAFLHQAAQQGWIAPWVPTLATNSLPLEGQQPLYVPVPSMPALCAQLLAGTTSTWAFAVDSLHLDARGWQIQAGGARHHERFDAVVLALPPAQAAPLLRPHQREWAQQAATTPMQPCWTLMGVADAPAPAPTQPNALNWDLARPPSGPLAWVLHSDARPGRERVPGQAHWVVHAQTAWSCEQLEQTPAWVQHHMQAALDEYLGQPVAWRHSVVHRWRYALPQTQNPQAAQPFWWSAEQNLGVCGDFLGGCGGAEGAWQSARALSAALLACVSPSPLLQESSL